jgi:uncharacterized protein (DUF488 family)
MAAILTIGHSSRSIEKFIQLLQTHGVQRVVDIRTVPRSRHNPQFNRTALPGSLKQAGIGYTHTDELGGLRHARKDSPNTGWRNASFRGYADYMQTPKFAAAIVSLIGMAAKERVAIMCAEAVPWRCHRSLVADALQVRGVEVAHILNGNAPRPHSITPFACVVGTAITYPAEPETETLPFLPRSSPPDL